MRTLFISLLLLVPAALFAQTDAKDNFQSAMDACIAMSEAAAKNDTAALRQSAAELKSSNVSNFSSLRCADDSVGSVDGHLVFDEAFADSLSRGKTSVYRNSDEFNRTRTSRGQTANGSILTKTCFVKAGRTTRYTFASKGHQDLAVVAEAGGRVTMKIHVTNRQGLDKRFDDTKNVRKGMSHRRASFDLPNNVRNTVTLDVVNCTNKDISFVVISN